MVLVSRAGARHDADVRPGANRVSVAVLIPWRAGCSQRTRALAHIRTRYAREHPGWHILLGNADAGAWVKATAVADALKQTAAEVLVVADADVWADQLEATVAQIRAGAGWGIPHRGVQRLTEASTSRWISGEPWPGLELAERAYLGVEGGGIVVLRREVYDACPLDPRFAGWGSEDEAWGFALRTLHGAPVRERGALVHLWHPPQQRATRSRGSDASWQLRKRYARALGNTPAMTALIEEAKAHVADPAAQPAADHPQPHPVG